MRRSAVLVSAPASTALTTFTAVSDELGTPDQRLLGLIDQASSLIGDYLGRELARATVRETFRLDWSDDGLAPLFLARTPVATISALVDGGAALDVSSLDFDPASGLLHRCRQSHVTVVTYDGGYVLPGQPNRDLPASIERACIDTVVALWHRAGRGDPMIRSESVEGIGATSYLDPASGSAAALPPTAVAILEGYRRL